MTMLRPLDLVLGKLEHVKPNGRGVTARCPAHDDRHASLSVAEGDDGRVLLRCHAGCDLAAILAALDLTPHDLFAGDGRERPRPRLTATTDYRVCDPAGQLHGIHRRRDYSDGSKQVLWLQPDGRTLGLAGRKLDTLPLYGAERLPARPGEPVVLTEGEKATDALTAAGRLAVGTVTGAAGTPGAAALATLRDRPVLLWPDHDAPGRAHMTRIGATLARLGIAYRVIVWPDAPDKGDAYDLLAAGGDLAALLAAATPPDPAEAADAAAATPEPPPDRRRRIIRAGAGPLTPPEYLIDQVLPRDGLAALVAKEASYKSFIAVGMAAAIYTGQPWIGRDTERRAVLYLAAEGAGGMRRRLRAWELAHDADLADLLILPAPVNFLDGGDLGDLAGELGTLDPPPGLIVVDTLARNFGGGNENGADDMGRFVAACDRLRLATGACVLIVHHETKLGGYRGSSAFAGALDTLIEAKREGNAVTLNCKKQKDDQEFDPLHLAARVVELGFTDRHARPVTSIVMQPTDAAFVLRQREESQGAAVLSKNERIALDTLNAWHDRRASFSDWLRATGLARNSFDRARQSLIEKGLIRNLSNGYAVTPKSPPNDPQTSHPQSHPPKAMGLGVTAGLPWEEGDPDELPY